MGLSKRVWIRNLVGLNPISAELRLSYVGLVAGKSFLCSCIMHLFMITIIPASFALVAACSFIMSSCIQTTCGVSYRSLSLMACSTIGGTSSDGRNMSTISIFLCNSGGMDSRSLKVFWSRISFAVGFTGMMLYSCSWRYFATMWLYFLGSRDNPTTAMVLYLVRMSLMSCAMFFISCENLYVCLTLYLSSVRYTEYKSQQWIVS